MIFSVYTCIRDQHDLRLVLLAGLICYVSTAIGFDMLGRARRHGEAGSRPWLWLVGAAIVSSTGIWATHFLAILAFSFGSEVGFDGWTTASSMAVGWVGCLLGFAAVFGKATPVRILAAGAGIGCGIALLHYVGMRGLQVPFLIVWNSDLILMSVVGDIAFATLSVALFLSGKSFGSRLVAAAALSLGVVLLHFTGMAALSIVPDAVSTAVVNAVSNATISFWVIAGVSVIAALALLTSAFDQVLARRNVDETRRLSELTRKLERALEEAKAADKTKSEFLAMMSHEIRTPLTGMIGMIDLLCRSGNREEQRRYAELAKDSADNLLAVINDVLDFSRLDAGNWEAESVDFDAVKLATSTVETFRPAAELKKVALKLELLPDLQRWLKGDPTKIRQILVNLLSNALKFTETGTIEVKVGTNCAADAVELRIEVIDSGIGISPDARSRLFAPFVQEDSSMSRRYGGSGLGLAISKRLCSMMSGDIGVDVPASGTGSRFWFIIRCGVGSPAVPETVAPPLAPSGPCSILVAEDTPIIADLLCRLLKNAGHYVSLVTNGADAVAALRAEHFDVVVMDVQMPGMDGLAATRAIRTEDGPHSRIPIIALTAHAMANDQKRCVDAGMNDYVTKPIRPAALLAAVARCTVALNGPLASCE